jgi:YebC/PmpR family DNA-binding regulatory protein
MGRSFEVRKVSMAKTAAAKAKVYSKYGKELYVVAKGGGADPDTNVTLRRLIEKAKKDQVPSHVIEKALEKSQGVGGEDYVPARYEGYGPNGSMLIVDCLTDNNNRTIGEVRNCFTKTKAKLGAPGCAAHMFDHRAVFSLKHDDEDAVLEALMMEDVDVIDIETEGESINIYTDPNEFFKTKTALNNAFPDITLDKEEITFIPQVITELSGDDVATFEKLYAMLEDCDDVQEIYHNAEIAD